MQIHPAYMPGAIPNDNAYRRLGFALGLSLCMHLAALFKPALTVPELSDVTASRQELYLNARLLAPAPESAATIDDKLPERVVVKDTIPNFAIHASAPLKESPIGRAEIFEIDEVDVRPWIRNRVMPEYPPTLPPGIFGVTILRFIVDEGGQVTEVEIAHPASEPMFDLFAVEAFSKASYTPALINKKPVKVRMQIAIRFN